MSTIITVDMTKLTKVKNIILTFPFTKYNISTVYITTKHKVKHTIQRTNIFDPYFKQIIVQTFSNCTYKTFQKDYINFVLPQSNLKVLRGIAPNIYLTKSLLHLNK